VPVRIVSRVRSAAELIKLFMSGGALFVGLLLLKTLPLIAVLIILGAMGSTLSSSADLYVSATSKAEVLTQQERDSSTKGAT